MERATGSRAFTSGGVVQPFSLPCDCYCRVWCTLRVQVWHRRLKSILPLMPHTTRPPARRLLSPCMTTMRPWVHTARCVCLGMKVLPLHSETMCIISLRNFKVGSMTITYVKFPLRYRHYLYPKCKYIRIRYLVYSEGALAFNASFLI